MPGNRGTGRSKTVEPRLIEKIPSVILKT